MAVSDLHLDSVQVHLLVETAKGDSKEFEILPQSDVDTLKRDCQLLEQRIEQTRQTLLVQTKYRDAAISVSRLDAREDELRASEQRCDELAQELVAQEKRLADAQMRLLRHTAATLRTTHPAVPGSPESMADDFDERSWYRSAHQLDGDAPDLLGALGLQDKSITDTADTLTRVNANLRSLLVKANPQHEDLPQTVGSDAAKLDAQLRFLERGVSALKSDTGSASVLASLNARLHRALLALDADVRPPPDTHDVDDQLAYLETAVDVSTAELERVPHSHQQNFDQVEATLMGLWDIMQAGEEEVRRRKREHRQARTAKGLPLDSDDSGEESEPSPQSFSLQGFSSKVQLIFTEGQKLKEQKKVLQRQIKQQRELNLKSDSAKDAEIHEKTDALRRVEHLLEQTEADADHVREQLSATLAELEAAQELSDKNAELQQAAEAHLQSIQSLQAQLDDTQTRHESELQSLQNLHENALQGVVSDHEGQLQRLRGELETNQSQHESELQQLRSLHETELQSQLQHMTPKEDPARFQTLLREREGDLEKSHMEIARLQTELTIARAELDGAYGTRAERAAEVAANPAIQREFEELNLKNYNLAAEVEAAHNAARSGNDKAEALKRELKGMIAEFEEMTKASIEWERERDELESHIDRLRDEKDGLDQELTNEKVRWLGMSDVKLPTSTTVLKNEFKKMMREAQAKSNRALRAEQAERRRLEDELRTLKRQQGPGKSSLSQSMSP